MSTYLLTCTPAHGHVAPLLTVARHLVATGHRVRLLTSVRYADRVRATGAEFLPLPADADVNLDDPNTAFPERANLTGVAALRFDILNLFLRPGRRQYEAVQAAIGELPTDAVLTEPMFIGAALLNEMPRSRRPAVIALGIFPLGAKSRDTAPFGLGVLPRPGVVGRIRNAALSTFAEKVLFAPVTREANALASEMAGSPLSRFLLDWTTGADAVAQFTVPEFEYPRSDLPDTVHFIGPLPATPPPVELPAWWADLDGTRPIVHVTQGTVANTDVTQLLRPTIDALAGDDVLVVATTGGRPVEALGELPANARVAAYLPYGELLPRVDVLVTNGGYGGVHQALAQSVPLVVAGQAEDKVEVSARVGWSGVGINLKTNRPDAAAVGNAVRTVLRDPSYRARARDIGAAIAESPGMTGLDSILESVRLGRLSGSSLSA